jgi:hypothetical protein
LFLDFLVHRSKLEPTRSHLFLKRLGKVEWKGVRTIGRHVRIGDIKFASFDLGMSIHGVAEGRTTAISKAFAWSLTDKIG